MEEKIEILSKLWQLIVGLCGVVGAVAVLFYKVKKFDGDIKNIAVKNNFNNENINREMKIQNDKINSVHLDLSNKFSNLEGYLKGWLERDALTKKS